MKIFFRRIHLYLGLAAGLVILVACATGALLVFQKELEQAFNKQRYFTEVKGQRLSLDTLAQRVATAQPNMTVGSIRIYTDPSRNAEVNVNPKEKKQSGERSESGERERGGKREEGKRGAGGPAQAEGAKRGGGGEGRGAGLTVFVDPYTGNIKEVYNARNSFFFKVMALHRWLLGSNEGPGKWITGIATFIFLFILITGIILWWPKTRRILKQRLRVRRDAGWKRLNHDLHVVLGFYSAIFLFVFAFTALPMSFQWFNKGIYTVTRSPLKAPAPPAAARAEGPLVSFDTALHTASGILPKSVFYTLALPREAGAPLTVTALSENAVHESATDQLYLDPHSGAVLGTLLYGERSLGARVRSTFRPVHVGSIGGWPSKIIACIVCLLGVTFPITGVIMWWNRKKF